MSSSKNHGPVYRLAYAIGFLIGSLSSLVLWPFTQALRSRRLKNFIIQDQRFNG